MPLPANVDTIMPERNIQIDRASQFLCIPVTGVNGPSNDCRGIAVSYTIKAKTEFVCFRFFQHAPGLCCTNRVVGFTV